MRLLHLIAILLRWFDRIISASGPKESTILQSP